jgi:hypothetical protein
MLFDTYCSGSGGGSSTDGGSGSERRYFWSERPA